MYPFPLYLQSALVQTNVSLVSDNAKGHEKKTSHRANAMKKSYSTTNLRGVRVLSRPSFQRSTSLPQMRSGSKSGLCRWQSAPGIEKGAKDAAQKMVRPDRTSDIERCTKDVAPKIVRPRRTSKRNTLPSRLDFV
jgi:hypothetical protein